MIKKAIATIMKLYQEEATAGNDSSALLVGLVAKLMRTEDLQAVKVGSDDAALRSKSVTGRFPVIEHGNVIVCDALPIARYLARDNA